MKSFPSCLRPYIHGLPVAKAAPAHWRNESGNTCQKQKTHTHKTFYSSEIASTNVHMLLYLTFQIFISVNYIERDPNHGRITCLVSTVKTL